MSTSIDIFSDATAQLSRLAAINAALRRLDPEAQVALDPSSGQMKVLTVLPEAEVVRLLHELGEPATPPSEPESDTCCGCGCRGGKG